MAVRGQMKTPVWTLANLGIKGLVAGVARTVNDCELSGYSAQLAYYFFLSLFPTLLVLTTLLAYLPITRRHGALLAFLGQVLPAQAMRLVSANLETLQYTHKGGLLSFGALFAVYSAGNALIAVSAGLNRTFGVRERRRYWQVWLMAVALIGALAVLLLVATALFFFGPWLLELMAVHLDWTVVPAVLDAIRWPVILGALIEATALVYHFAPDVRQEWHWITPGAVFSVAGWLVSSALFAFYVDHFGSYNRMYGSIGAVIVLLTWMYLSGWLLLVGGGINAVLAAARKAPPPATPHTD
ncbi:MAG: YihY/virulence factor BrkB family protein [Gammaproteobacteria bacterium]|nr:YihY/virulence factor BrkB family protein [Gammaproteobacteria bacterium]